jgi:hypothetical protein
MIWKWTKISLNPSYVMMFISIEYFVQRESLILYFVLFRDFRNYTIADSTIYSTLQCNIIYLFLYHRWSFTINELMGVWSLSSYICFYTKTNKLQYYSTAFCLLWRWLHHLTINNYMLQLFLFKLTTNSFLTFSINFSGKVMFRADPYIYLTSLHFNYLQI